MLFAITPDEDGKELDFVRQKWGKTDKSIRQMTKSGVSLFSVVVVDTFFALCWVVGYSRVLAQRICDFSTLTNVNVLYYVIAKNSG